MSEARDYALLENAFEQEFLHVSGGWIVIRNIKGLHLGSDNNTEFEPVNLVNADTPFGLDENFAEISRYTDELREAAVEASEEESVLVVVHEIYHSV